MDARSNLIRETLVRGGMNVHTAKSVAQEIEARQPLDPRTNPHAWDEKMDQFVAAALTGILMVGGQVMVDGKSMSTVNAAASIGKGQTELLYGPRPGGDDGAE